MNMPETGNNPVDLLKMTPAVVGGLVMLALDGIYKNGRRIASTLFTYIPNDYVMDLTRMNEDIFFGASVHPYRDSREMMAETRRCIASGAVLFNWLPSLQQIDPEDERCVPFYLCLAREGLPLLVQLEAGCLREDMHLHLDDPAKLTMALDCGVRVIVSPSCADNKGGDISDNDRNFNNLVRMLRLSHDRKWELYADIAGLLVPSGFVYLERIKKEIDFDRISPARFLNRRYLPMKFALSDSADMSCGTQQPVQGSYDFRRRSNPDFSLLRMHGFYRSTFADIREILRIRTHQTSEDRI